MKALYSGMIGALLASGVMWGKTAADVMELEEEIAQLRMVIDMMHIVQSPPIPVVKPEPAPEPEPEPQDTTLAQRNNNPLNIKGTGWEGQIGTDKLGHAIFSSPDYGVRAAALVLRSYNKKHGIQSVQAIVNRFCRTKGGIKKQYIDYLCQELQVKPNEKFDLIRRMPELLKAMARFESGEELPERYYKHYDILAKL